MKINPAFVLLICFFQVSGELHAQDKLYPNEFPLSDVKLLDGPFKHARDINIHTLLQYDVDRLLAAYRKEAGLPAKASGYSNWEGLDGHVGGHYLTAMAMNYAATNDAECKRRLEYMISELKACQDANAINHPDWGKGYVGGAPNSKAIWSTLQQGDFAAYRSAWVPWYNVHKMYAGLRDAWLYTGNEEAKAIFLKFCDWALNVTAALTDDQMQAMLDTEHSRPGEVTGAQFVSITCTTMKTGQSGKWFKPTRGLSLHFSINDSRCKGFKELKVASVITTKKRTYEVQNSAHFIRSVDDCLCCAVSANGN